MEQPSLLPRSLSSWWCGCRENQLRSELPVQPGITLSGTHSMAWTVSLLNVQSSGVGAQREEEEGAVGEDGAAPSSDPVIVRLHVLCLSDSAPEMSHLPLLHVRERSPSLH